MITITEIYDYNVDKKDSLVVNFTITGDPVNTYRELKTSDYYDWAKENDNEKQYHFVEQFCDHPDENGHSEYVFDFSIWQEYEHNEDKVKEFLEDTYDSVVGLPTPLTFD